MDITEGAVASPPAMSYKIEIVKDDDDLKSIVPIFFDAYSTPYNSTFQMYCPNPDGPIPGPLSMEESIKEVTARFVMWKSLDLSQVWIKAIDDKEGSETYGQIVGAALWNFYPENPWPEERLKGEGFKEYGAYWWSGEGMKEEKEFASQVLGTSEERSRKWMRRPHLNLEAIMVPSTLRGKGLGSQLISWGLARADEMKIITVVEAVPFSVPIYQKAGFKTADEETSTTAWKGDEQPSEKWKKMEKEWAHHILFMWRPVGGKWEDGMEAPWKKET